MNNPLKPVIMKCLRFKTKLRTFNIRTLFQGILACTYANAIKKGLGEMTLNVREHRDGRIRINILVTPKDEKAREVLRRKVELNIERMKEAELLHNEDEG